MIFSKGDAIIVTCDDHSVAGEVVLAAENDTALLIKFEAILAGHVNMMPLFRIDGVWLSIIDGTEVTIERRRLNS